MKALFLAGALWVSPLSMIAQHDHHGAQPTPQQDTVSHTMTHAFSLNLPMNRNGSGTSWMPDAVPIYAWMKHAAEWSYMLHGSVFVRASFQNFNNDYRRGGRQFDVPNWVMGMAQRRVGENGLLLLRGMFSLDRITVGGAGYPLLFQTGETWKGSPLIDKQHPHDLVAELGAGYTHRLGERTDLSFYVGYPGEPALGPTAFMHRISSLNNPDAPLGHHWQDASHITFGVATVGLRYGAFKVEASSFTGREPDERRFGFDTPRFDSYSYRLSVNPSPAISLQVSQGFLNSPDVLEPETDVVRTTASVLHAVDLAQNAYLASALVWGFNDAGGHHRENSVLAETTFQKEKWAVYGRAEWIEKSSEELVLPQFADEIFEVSALTLGTNYQLPGTSKINIAVGGQLSWNIIPSELGPVYGSNPLSAQVYLRIMPPRLQMNHHH